MDALGHGRLLRGGGGVRADGGCYGALTQPDHTRQSSDGHHGTDGGRHPAIRENAAKGVILPSSTKRGESLG